MREWRKIGDGNLYIEGTGDNQIFLNVGGDGHTILNQTNGYAAYNVLVNNGSTVKIADIGQIARDLTFGNRGGVLDMNGHSMIWNNDNDASADGFTIHALDEGAIITNTATGTTTLTWTQTGEQTWLGSFRDTEQGALKFIYNGGEGSALTMHSIYTNLSSNEASGIEVQSGTLSLKGTNTVHAMGSATGTNTARYFHEDDWHYADATTDVTVTSGTFKLDSHARLTGDVTVENGGVFVMAEGVKHQMEYIEGGYELEDTDSISAFFGLKGNVTVKEGGAMRVEFSEGTTSNLNYGYSISGAGSLELAMGDDGGTLTLSGDNSNFTGAKTLTSGGLIATTLNALGDTTTNKWKIDAAGWLASAAFTSEMSNEAILSHIHGDSTGVLALTADRNNQFDLSNHKGLIIGAQEGMSVNYGVAGTAEKLNAVDGQWVLGGGGGNLIVNFMLTGDAQLVLGNEYGKGTVTLTNTNNDFTSDIIFKGGVTLDYTDKNALGKGNIELSYSNRSFSLTNLLDLTPETADGVVLMDRDANVDIDLSNRQQLAIGADADMTYSGKITVADGTAYRFGGITGNMVLASSLSAGHDLILDGQTYTGGTLTLNTVQSGFNGAVTVMGYDSTKTQNALGDIVLSFNRNDALANAASVNVKDGGVIDLNGTTQTLRDLTIEANGLVRDSSADGTGTLILNATKDLTWSGSLDVYNVEKTGNNTLTLSGANWFETFTVKEGGIAVGSSDALSTGTLRMEAGTTLALNGYTISGNVELGDATVSGKGTLSGALHVTGTNAVVAASGGAINMNGELSLVAGAQLTLTGSEYVIGSSSFGSAGGTVKFTTPNMELNFNTSEERTFNGTMSFDGSASGKTAWFYVYDRGYNENNVNRTFEHINVADKGIVQFNLGEVSSNANTIYTVHSLTGTGMRFQIRNTNSNANGHTTRLILDGAGDFTGAIMFDNYSEEKDAAKQYNMSLELAHDDAARNATVYVRGGSVSAELRSMLAVNTDNAKVGWLFGDEYAHAYAGSAITMAQGTAPTGTRVATLTITGAYDENQYGAEYVDQMNTQMNYKGSVGGDKANGYGIHLVMNGSGYQNFSGSSLLFEGIEAKTGTLRMNGAGLELINDATIHGGGTLTICGDSNLNTTGALTLNTGNTLNVTDAITTQAVLNGNIVLNGGGLAFDADGISGNGTALLQLNGTVTYADGVNAVDVSLVNNTDLKTGVTYILSTGDWRSISADTITAAQPEYLDAAFSVSASGLSVEFSEKSGYMIWNGTGDAMNWDSNTFGVDTVNNQSGQIAVFTDEAAGKVVRVTEDGAVRGVLIDADQDGYTFSSAGGVITAQTLTKNGAGEATLALGLQVTGLTTINEGVLYLVDPADLKGGVTGEGALRVSLNKGENVSIAGISNLNELQLMGGKWTIAEGEAPSVSHMRLNSSNAELALTENAVYGGNVTLENKAVLSSAGAATETFARSDEMDKHYEVATALNGNVSAAGVGNKVTGNFAFGGAEFGTTGAEITLSGQAINLTSSGTQNFNGTLHFDGSANADKTITVGDGDFAAANVKRNFEHVNIVDGTTVKLNTVYLDSQGSSMIYTVNKLTGTGDFYWHSFETASEQGSSRLILNGEGDLNGTITLDRDFGQAAHPYNASIELAHDLAAQNAVIHLDGNAANARASLAVNTSDAAVAGLTGNSYAHVYAGAGMSVSSSTAPTSTAQATLSITGSATYAYAGTVSGANSGKGLSISMEGSGTQSFTGSGSFDGVYVSNDTGALVLGNMTVKKAAGTEGSITGGTVSFTSKSAEIAGAAGANRAKMSYTDISLTANTTLTLANVALDSTVNLSSTASNTQYRANVIANDVLMEMDGGMFTHQVGSALSSDSMLSMMGNTASTVSLTGTESVYELTLKSENMSKLYFSGSSLTLDLTGLGTDLKTLTADCDLLALNFTAADSVFDVESLSISVRTDMGVYDAYYEAAMLSTLALDPQAATTDTLYLMLVVPEPGTASLSLLGLAALLMRRRRA